ncbi:major facilitator superfamily domain-containing protein [Gloeopeniophorella convolvens]|nr:major facilitator superfamily domain-containing protein [Gloeopeniophorella convolvens]
MTIPRTTSMELSPTATIIDPSEDLTWPERRLEEYGGNDPEEPSPKHLPRTTTPHLPPAGELIQDFVTWDGPNDPHNPQNWSRAYRWWVTAVVCVLTINVTFASSAPTSATHLIARDLHVSTETADLTTTVFLLGYVAGPPLWGPGSELLGRKPVSLITLGLYAILHIGQARANNIGALLSTRFLGGFFACAPLTNAGGIIADMWDPVTRGLAISVFTASVFIGPVLGPIVGGFIAVSDLGWRWIFWVMMIFACSCTVFGVVFLPETYAPALLAQKAKRLRKLDPEANKDKFAESEGQKWSLVELLHRTIFRPFKMILVEPILSLITAYMSLVYGLIYALFEAFPLIFIGKRGFTIPQDGLIFIGIGLGALFAVVVTWWFLRPYPRLLEEWKGYPPPEKRLPPGMLAGPLLVVGILWLGWTGNYASVPWYVPALGTILIGMSIILVFISFLSYLVDTYLMYAASAFAANTMIRSAVAAAFPLFTVQMFNGMGINWAATLIAGVALLLAPIPFIFYKYGPRIRAGSKFAPCMDLEIAKELENEKKKKLEV